ncbi:MAG: M15 family metallopeptidase [Candidatus Rokubacteria bacterium]|nr:M15 family metallopeptidase [Candidatus Rokubacteria bacterium]
MLARGSTGPDVERWQSFLRGRELYHGAIDGSFGELLEAATRDYQSMSKLRSDGIVGQRTWGLAVSQGLDTGVPDDGGTWPPKPAGLVPYTSAEMHGRFGTIIATPDPIPTNPEQVRATNPDGRIVLERVVVPEFSDVTGGPRGGLVMMHAAAAEPFRALVDAWRREGLLKRVRSWGGSYAPRYVRGSRTTLSRHAWGTAFDINSAWNGLGVAPPARDAPGSVRDLVPVAVELGWYWGGWFSRPDGMHFERGKKP